MVLVDITEMVAVIRCNLRYETKWSLYYEVVREGGHGKLKN